MELTVVVGGEAAMAAALRERPALCLLDAEMSDVSGYEISRRIKQAVPESRVILVLGARIGVDQMREVTRSGCDEVLIAPMAGDQLYDVVAIQLGLPRRGAQRYEISLAVVTHAGEHA